MLVIGFASIIGPGYLREKYGQEPSILYAGSKKKGTMIAEYALMSLGAFKFEFDPVFREVPVLPLLNLEDFLVIE